MLTRSAKLARPATTASSSPWAPLRSRAFRGLWLATSTAGAGAAMQSVAAQSLILGGSPGAHGGGLLTTEVQAASMLPMLLLGLPAGVLADLVDRRRLLIAAQLAIAVTGVLQALLCLDGGLGSALLLVLQFALGAGAALTLPAIGSLTRDLVSCEELPQACALGSISANAARAAGPAVGGFVIARAGPSVVFGLHALTVLGLVAVFFAGRSVRRGAPQRSERLGAAALAGCRYVRRTPVVRRILGHALLYVVPGAALWALLPMVAGQRLGLGVGGYGLLLGALGVGAVLGALVQPRLRAVPARDRAVIAASTYLLALVAVAVCHSPVIVAGVLVAAGAAWVLVLAGTNAAIEALLPDWVRARGLAVYQVVLFGGQGLATIGWGCCAQCLGLPLALLLAAGVLGAGVLAVRRWPMTGIAEASPAPEAVATQPETAGGIQDACVVTVPGPGRSRRLTGGVAWRPRRMRQRPPSLPMPAWDDLVRHHGRGRSRPLVHGRGVALACAKA